MAGRSGLSDSDDGDDARAPYPRFLCPVIQVCLFALLVTCASSLLTRMKPVQLEVLPPAVGLQAESKGVEHSAAYRHGDYQSPRTEQCLLPCS